MIPGNDVSKYYIKIKVIYREKCVHFSFMWYVVVACCMCTIHTIVD